jgi:hypothetical protein
MAKKRRKPKPKPRNPSAKQIARAGERIIEQREILRPLIREAAKAGAAEAIEHCRNFWNADDGYKRYIDYQVKMQAEALMAAVRTALREERSRRPKARG